jgi:DNA (cytosine-5)-methyltransferase 1
MIEHFLRGIKIIEPDIISMENVRGITKTQVFSDFVTQVKKMKYKVSYEVINCANYGIPQNRSRLVFLASKLGNISVPQKTHTKDNHVSINKIIKKLPVLKSGEACKKDKVHKTRNLFALNIKRMLIETWLSFVCVFCGTDILPNLDAKKTNLLLFCGMP